MIRLVVIFFVHCQSGHSLRDLFTFFLFAAFCALFRDKTLFTQELGDLFGLFQHVVVVDMPLFEQQCKWFMCVAQLVHTLTVAGKLGEFTL